MSFFDESADDIDKQKAADDEASNANKFVPKAGEMVQAVLLKAELYTGGKYDPNITITFRNVGDDEVGTIPAGESGRMFLQTVLKRKMVEAAPSIGSPFMLRYEGKVKPESGGNSYNDWTLVTPFTKSGDEKAHDRGLWDSIDPDQQNFRPSPKAAAAAEADDGWKF